MNLLRVIKRSASPALAVTAGLILGSAIRNVIHHGHSWPLLAGIGAVLFAAAFAVHWVPYRIERRKLLRRRDYLLGMQDALGDIMQHFPAKTSGYPETKEQEQ